MKSVFPISFLSVFLVLFAFADQAEAYYNPQSGRFMSRDPIGERGGTNVYAFVRNAPISHIDILGLKRLKLRYRMLEKDNVREAFHIKGTYAKNLLAMVADASHRIRKYHPEGIDPCDCIEKIEIVAHGGEEDRESESDSRGIMQLGEDNITQYTMKNHDRYIKMRKAFMEARKRGDKKRADILRRVVRSTREDASQIRRFKDLAKLMCKDGKVEFVVCGAGGGSAGKKLKQDMERIFGSGNVIMYEGNCQMSFGNSSDADNAKKQKK